MSTLNLLLGAGFSYPAGLPLVSEISRFFNRRIYDELRMHSSGEWFWKENGEGVANDNGGLNSDHIVYAFVFEEIMRAYGELKNYEEFYDFLIKKENEWFREIFDTAKERCKVELKLQPDSNLISLFESYQYQKVIEIFNYLIIDTLRVRLGNGDLVKAYGPFFSYLERYKKINIFTLNHDLLFETLLGLLKKTYSDGFTVNKSTIIGDKDEPQPSFQDSFDEDICIYKLHGSAGLYRYPAGIDRGGIIDRTGEVIYFKPTSHSNKHTSRRIDAEGTILQSLNLDPSPKFITGKDKAALISKDPMYSTLFKRFELQMETNSDLFIVGYSFGDDHVNRILQAFGPYRQVVNVNPSKTYPFANARKIIDLKYLPDIAGLR